ncbi:MAG: tetratricopeptide repeat protein [Fimbriimonadaceae bacterium]|nr:tetratricopeptide repeat protein [Fimbriimonadaceae bacterium]
MSVAVLPFNAGPDTRPTLARQFANFAAEVVRARTQAEVHSVNYLMQVSEEQPAKYANVNPSEGLNEIEMVKQLFDQTNADAAMDGLLVESNGQLKLTYRIFAKGTDEPVTEETFSFDKDGVFSPMRTIIEELCARAEVMLPAEAQTDDELFGTTSSEAFLQFIEGYDALQYIEKTQGQVINEFNPKFAYDALGKAIELDKDWEAPYATLLNLCRACTQLRVGSSDDLEGALNKAIQTAPDDIRARVVLAEYYQATNNPAKSLELLEEALKLDGDEPAIYTRMGVAQNAMGQVAEAETSFQKAVDLEPADKPSMGFLAQVIASQGRAHEVPMLWREVVEANPENSHAWAHYGASLVAAGNEAEALRAFDEGLEKAKEPLVIKRAYAPALSHVQEFDKAMDYYEDVIEMAPQDVQVLVEYAQTLQAAGRTFEVPKVLRDVLGANPDPNTRAQTLAWLVELEQPKRVESVSQAQEKMNANDFEGAVKILRPMRNWLADYWKMWALYAAALNRTNDHREAEEAANRLIQLFPGNELGFAELANALGPQGKHEEQYNAMRFGLQTIPNSLPIVINYGLAAKRLGKTDEAEHIAAMLKQVASDNPELQDVIAELEK